MMTWMKVGIFFRNIWNGILGIAAEVLLVLFFIAAGFVVCFLWWSYIR